MFSRLQRAMVQDRSRLLTASVIFTLVAYAAGAGKSPMKVLKYDPSAEKVEMFDAIESGLLTVRIVAHNAKGGNMYFENTSGKSLTVELPEALATVHVLKQFGGGFGALGAAGAFGGGGLSGGSVTGGGQQGGFGGGQSGGAGFGGQGGFGQSGGGGGGGGFFSIPPERVVQVPYQSVCLNYSKPDPSPRMTYIPVRLEQYTDDKVLRETLRMFGTGQLDQPAAQAAAWHLTDNLTWDQLTSLREYTLPGVYTSQVPTFSAKQLQTAHNIVTYATKLANDRSHQESDAKSTPAKTRRSRAI